MSSSLISSSSTSNEVEQDELLGSLLDVRCPVDVVLGNGIITIRDVLQLQWHSIVPLKQSAGSDLLVSVHGVSIASGEIVIVDESTALRVNRMTPPPGVETA
jgi:flagellar motor switch protein FliN/FliY